MSSPKGILRPSDSLFPSANNPSSTCSVLYLGDRILLSIIITALSLISIIFGTILYTHPFSLFMDIVAILRPQLLYTIFYVDFKVIGSILRIVVGFSVWVERIVEVKLEEEKRRITGSEKRVDFGAPSHGCKDFLDMVGSVASGEYSQVFFLDGFDQLLIVQYKDNNPCFPVEFSRLVKPCNFTGYAKAVFGLFLVEIFRQLALITGLWNIVCCFSITFLGLVLVLTFARSFLMDIHLMVSDTEIQSPQSLLPLLFSGIDPVTRVFALFALRRSVLSSPTNSESLNSFQRVTFTMSWWVHAHLPCQSSHPKLILTHLSDRQSSDSVHPRWATISFYPKTRHSRPHSLLEGAELHGHIRHSIQGDIRGSSRW